MASVPQQQGKVGAKKIAAILGSRSPRLLKGTGLKPAAVLVPLQETEQGDCMILTQRGAKLNSHRGEVAFPGGVADATDASPLCTALRESWEEIGLEGRDIQILGQLDQVTTSSIHLVTPFVGFIPFPYEFRLNEAETRAVFSVPIPSLLEPSCFRVEMSAGCRPVYHFHYQSFDIWGATARIIKQLLELVYGFHA